MALFSSFEVLAETLVPAGLLPPTVPNPLLLQGYFVQISLQPGQQTTQFNIVFNETTGFTQGTNQKALFAQIIDANGNVNVYSQFFSSISKGFLNQTINPNQTLIYGLQAIPIPKFELAAPLPQGGIGWRGTVAIDAQFPGTLFATATHRQVFFQGPTIASAAINGTAYAVPTFSGNGSI